MDEMHKEGFGPRAICRKSQAARARAGESGPSLTAVKNFDAGVSYKRGRSETRGRRGKLPKRMVRVASQERVKLIQAAKNEYLVTWGDVHKATRKALREQGQLTRSSRMPREDWFARKIREATPVRARPGKRRIARTREHEKKRFEQGKEWVKKPQTFWEEQIHAYIDNKKFVVAKTSQHKRLLRASKVHHHLRTPSEGCQPGFVLPKKNHMLVGIPSVEITAAVAQGRIILWHESPKPWNGKKAAAMYAKLGEALRAHYGPLPKFRVVEDGDTKGFQSNLGKKAKADEKIESWLLPPRSPGWMPLDYSLWDDIEDRVLAKRGHESESFESYKKRLCLTAKRLPSHVIKEAVSKMKSNIQETVDSKGKHTTVE